MYVRTANRRHKRLWNWLAENPDKEKTSWPEWRFNGGKVESVFNLCFMCQIVPSCHVCKKYWPGYTWCAKSIYNEWKNETKLKKRTELARQIANITFSRK